MAAGPAHSAELLEREAEVETLDALLGAVADGAGGRFVVLEADAGVGKTRLLAEVRRRAEGRLRVLSARGGELEQDLAFGVVRQLFELPLADDTVRGQMLSGPAAAAASVFAVIDDEAAGEGSFATLHGLYWLVLNLAARQPLLLAVDDLHWCDRSSLRFLAYLARRLEDAPVLLATTLRTAEPGTDPGLLAELVRDPLSVAVPVHRLSAAGSTRLVREVLPAAEEAFCAECHAATGGVPLLLRQLVRALEADGVEPVATNAEVVRSVGPRAVSRTVLARMARLSPAALAVAQAVAVLGEGAVLPHVTAYTELDEPTVLEAVRALARAEILRAEPPLGFVHALVRHAVYDELTATERERAHARAAAVLRAAGAPPEVVAGQLLLAPAGLAADAFATLDRAADAAAAHGAPDGAVAYLRRALDEAPSDEERVRVLRRLGRVEQEVDAPAGVAHLREAYPLILDPVERGRAAYELVNTALFVDNDEALRIVRHALDELPADLEDLRRALRALEAVGVYFAAGGLADVPWLEEAAAGVPAEGFGARALEAVASSFLVRDGRDAAATGELAHRALADGQLMSEDSGLFWVAGAIALGVADRVDEAERTFRAARENAHRRGSLFTALTVHLWQGAALRRAGDLESARASLADADEEMALWTGGARHTHGYTIGLLGGTLVESGALDAGEQLLARGGLVTGRSDAENFLRHSRVLLHLARGNRDEALAAARELATAAAHVGNPAWLPWRTLLGSCFGPGEEARALAEEELELARRWGTASVVGRGLAALGSLEGEAGIPRLIEATELLAGAPARLEEARGLLALGRALRLARRPTDAREPLRRALELAESCGAGPLVDDVRGELYAAGARPRTSAQSGPASLTPSERRVAVMAAEGRTNREIAQALYVTPKTVEVHLSNAYRKLGVSSRRHLAGALPAPA